MRILKPCLIFAYTLFILNSFHLQANDFKDTPYLAKYKEIRIIGDSLSYAGEYQKLSNIKIDRFSNGPVYWEYLKEALPHTRFINTSTPGAMSDEHNFLYNHLSHIQPQAAAYAQPVLYGAEQQYNYHITNELKYKPEETLYLIWVGANDVFQELNFNGAKNLHQTAGVIAKNVGNIISRLHKQGPNFLVPNFLVLGLPDMTRTPRIRNDLEQKSQQIKAGLQQGVLNEQTASMMRAQLDGFTQLLKSVSPQYAEKLQQELMRHNINANYAFIPTDIFMELFFDNKAFFGFLKDNVTLQNAMLAGVGVNPDEHIFIDDTGHPTTKVHRYFAWHLLPYLVETKQEQYRKFLLDTAYSRALIASKEEEKKLEDILKTLELAYSDHQKRLDDIGRIKDKQQESLGIYADYQKDEAQQREAWYMATQMGFDNWFISQFASYTKTDHNTVFAHERIDNPFLLSLQSGYSNEIIHVSFDYTMNSDDWINAAAKPDYNISDWRVWGGNIAFPHLITKPNIRVEQHDYHQNGFYEAHNNYALTQTSQRYHTQNMHIGQTWLQQNLGVWQLSINTKLALHQLKKEASLIHIQVLDQSHYSEQKGHRHQRLGWGFDVEAQEMEAGYHLNLNYQQTPDMINNKDNHIVSVNFGWTF